MLEDGLGGGGAKDDGDDAAPSPAAGAGEDVGRRLGQIQISSDLGDGLPAPKTRWTALALNSSLKLRLGLRGFLSSAMLDTVSAFRKVSTEADQAHVPRTGV